MNTKCRVALGVWAYGLFRIIPVGILLMVLLAPPVLSNSTIGMERSVWAKTNQEISQEDQISALIKEGKSLYSRKEYRASIEKFKSALRLESENKTALSYIGKCEQKLADAEKKAAEKKLEKQIAGLYESGVKAFKGKDFPKAKEKFFAILALDDGHSKAKRYIKLCDKELARSEEDAKARASSAEKAKKDALKQEEEARAKALADQKKREAEAIVAQVSDLIKEGRSLDSKGDYKSAISKYEAAIKLDPENGKAEKYLSRAKSSLAEAEKKQAEKMARDAKASEKAAAEKAALAQKEAARKAEIAKKEAAEKNEKQVKSLISKGQKEYKSGQYEAAMSDFKAALSLEPNNRTAKKELARVEKAAAEAEQKASAAAKKARDEAAMAVKRAEEEASKQAAKEREAQIKSSYSAGLRDYKGKDYASSKQNLEKVLSLDPNNSKAKQLLSKVESAEKEAVRKANEKAEQARREAEEKLARENAAREKAEQERMARDKAALIEKTYDTANRAYKNKDYQAAIEGFEAVLELDSRNTGARKYLSRSRDALSRQEMEAKKAEEERLAKAAREKEEWAAKEKKEKIEANYKVGINEYNAAQLLERQKAPKAEVEQKLLTAEKALEQVLGLDRTHRGANNYQKKIEALRSDLAARKSPAPMLVAEESVKKSSESDDDKLKEEINEHLDAGRKLMKDKKYKDAKMEFEAVLARDPENNTARKLNDKATDAIKKEEEKQAKASMGEREKAEKSKEDALRRAAEANRKQSREYYENGLEFLGLAQYEEAKAEFEKALALDPGNERIAKQLNRAKQKLLEKEALLAKEERKKNEEAVSYYNQAKAAYEDNDTGLAIQNLERSLSIDPENAAAEELLSRIRGELKKEEARKEADEAVKAEEEANKMLMQTRINIKEFDDWEIKQLLQLVSIISGLNIIVTEGVEGTLTGSFKNVTIENLLISTLIPLGYKYERVGNTITISPDFKTKVFKLTTEQTRIMSDYQRSGELAEKLISNIDAKIVGREIELDERNNLLRVKGSAEDLIRAEEFIKNFRVDAPEQFATKTYRVRKDLGETILTAVKAILESRGVLDDWDHKVIYDKETDTLVIRALPEEHREIEDQISLLQRSRQELFGETFHLTSREEALDDSSEALVRKVELTKSTAELLEHMLYAAETAEEAAAQGRIMRANERYATISIIDTKANLEKVQAFVQTLPDIGGGVTSEVFEIQYQTPNDIQSKISQVLNRQFGGSGSGGGTFRQTLDVDDETPMTFGNAEISIIDVRGNNQNGDVLFNISTPISDREETIRVRRSRRIDNISIRVVEIDVDRGTADLEVREFGQQQQFQQQQPTQQRQQPIMIPDDLTNKLIVLVDDPSDLPIIRKWITELDVPLRQVNIEIKVVEIEENYVRELGLDWNIRNIGKGGLDLTNLDVANFQFANGLVSGGLSSAPAGSSSQTELFVKLDYLVGEGKASVITSAQVTTLNNEQASLSFLTTLPNTIGFNVREPTYDDEGNLISGTVVEPIISVDNVGFDLSVTPSISAGGTVTLRNINPVISEVRSTTPLVGSIDTETTGSTGDGTNITTDEEGNIISTQDTTNEQTTGLFSRIETRQIDTNAIVNDGDTIILSGLSSEKVSKEVSKLPLFGDLPLVGKFFQREKYANTRTNTMIFMTVHIIEQ